MKKMIWEIVEKSEEGNRVSYYFDVGIISLILLNVLAIILESIQGLNQQFGQYFEAFELFSIVIFTGEYLARLYGCVTNKKYAHPIWGRLKFSVTPMALVDLLAILPFYIITLGVDLRVIRMVRIVRIIRLAKLARYSASLQLFIKTFKSKREELILTILLMFFLLLITSTFMYYAEHEAQPDNFPNIPAAMWWAVATLTTVGYGDIYPITIAGKILGAISAMLGIGLFALPTGVLGAGFMEELGKRNKAETCPHCGKPLD